MIIIQEFCHISCLVFCDTQSFSTLSQQPANGQCPQPVSSSPHNIKTCHILRVSFNITSYLRSCIPCALSASAPKSKFCLQLNILCFTKITHTWQSHSWSMSKMFTYVTVYKFWFLFVTITNKCLQGLSNIRV
jgi:hypothetical protein